MALSKNAGEFRPFLLQRIHIFFSCRASSSSAAASSVPQIARLTLAPATPGRTNLNLKHRKAVWFKETPVPVTLVPVTAYTSIQNQKRALVLLPERPLGHHLK
jgi:hypothetical protein